MHRTFVTALVCSLATAGVIAGLADSSTTRAPKACLRAISAARTSFHVSADADTAIEKALQATSAYPTLVYQAAVAGQNGDSAKITSIANQMRGINSVVAASTDRIKTDAGRIGKLVGWFNGDAAGCQ